MKKYTADSHFLIGRTHTMGGIPCQDYALAESTNSYALAIVSDGCGSGRHTDIGSRIIALGTRKAFIDERHVLGVETPSYVRKEQGRSLTSASYMLDLKEEDLLATSVYAAINSVDAIIHICGDGVIAVKRTDGVLVLNRFDWVNNMPFYPAYTGIRYDQFIESHGGELQALRLTEEQIVYTPDGGWSEPSFCDYTLKDGITGVTIHYDDPMARERLEYIAVFTDGVTQVDGMDWYEAVASLLSFKNVVGSFAKRRMNRFLRDSEKLGKGPLDDIAYAVIRLDHGDNKEDTDDECDTTDVQV